MVDAIEKIANVAMERIEMENASNPLVKKLTTATEAFLRSHRMLGYGGTAINNLLPKEDQFYNPKYDIPDYDFYSETPQLHAMDLADKISKIDGVENVEVRPAAHLGTFKVFANYIGVADITQMDTNLFKTLWKTRVVKSGISYVSANFLRMGVYLELARPKGDVERWPKVYARLLLLNKNYPIETGCSMEKIREITPIQRERIEKFLIQHKAMLLGFNASSLQQGKNKWQFPLDIMVDEDKREATVKELNEFIDGKVVENEAYGHILPPSSEIEKDGNVLVRVYQPAYCHSYHRMPNGLRIASIPTLLQFFFSMLHGDEHIREKVSEHRLICVAQHLMEMAHGTSRRFKLLTPLECIGKVESTIDVKKERSVLYAKLSKNKSSAAFIEKFFGYKPLESTRKQKNKLRSILKKTIRNQLK